MSDLLDHVTGAIPAPGSAYTLIGVDGVDGCGKTTFTAALAERLRGLGRPCVVIHGDDFHHLRAHRHRLGRDSPLGFWLDSFDYEALRRHVLTPFGPGGDGRYRARVTDLAQDRHVDEPDQQAEPGTIVIIEGLFLHRDELAGAWDFSVFLDAPFEISIARMARRDGTPPDPGHPAVQRYVEGQQLYFRACRPWTRATLVIDNADPDRPRIVADRSSAART